MKGVIIIDIQKSLIAKACDTFKYNGYRFHGIPNLPYYAISKSGLLLEWIQEPIILTGIKVHKELTVSILIEGIRRNISLPKLILQIYCGDLPFPIRYINGLKEDCSTTNLEYDLNSVDITVSKNQEYVYLSGISFKKVPDIEDLYITDNGIVFDLHKKLIRKRDLDPRSYFVITKYHDGVPTKYRVHHMVYQAYIGPIEDGNIVHHRDSYIWNNYFGNLEACPQLLNIRYSFLAKNQRYELIKSVAEVEMICKLMSEGILDIEIASRIGIPDGKLQQFKALCSRLRSKIVFMDVNTYDYTEYYRAKRRVFTQEEVLKISNGISKMISYTDLYKMVLSDDRRHAISYRSFRDEVIRMLTTDRYDVSIPKDKIDQYLKTDFRRRYYLSPTQVGEILYLYDSGVSHPEIAKRYGITKKESSNIWVRYVNSNSTTIQSYISALTEMSECSNE